MSRATPYLKQYYMQKAAANQRSVPFELTFEEWLNWWGDDVERRGRAHKDALVMALINPELGYRLGNIEKRTKGAHSSFNEKAFQKKSIPIHTPLGEFASMSKAATAHKMYTMTVRQRCLSKNPLFTEWYIIDEKGAE